MGPQERSKTKLRGCSWFIGGLIGFFVLGGWQFLFNFSDWWYFITVKESHQQQIGLLEVLVWLTLGPGEGFLIGVFSGLAFEKWRARKLTKASVDACRE